jgi:cell wall-associated NlpC family hydrolase
MSTSPLPVATDLRSKVVQVAIKAMQDAAGTDYTPNGRTTEGFDCSGFVTYVLQQVFPDYKHMDTTHIASSADFTKVVAYRPGDLIFFPSGTVPYAVKHQDTRVYPNHVGVVVDHGHWISGQTSTGPGKVAMNNAWWGSRTCSFLSYSKLK